MAEPELIAETNRLLQRLVDMQTGDRAEFEKALQDLPNTPTIKPEVDDMKLRYKASMEKMREGGDRIREQELKYRQELLDELRTQTELLTRIAERLEK